MKDAVLWVAVLHLFLEVTNSSLCSETGYNDCVVRGVLQSDFRRLS